MSEIRADKIHNVTGDNDSGIDLSTNDQVIIKTADTTAVSVDASGRVTMPLQPYFQARSSAGNFTNEWDAGQVIKFQTVDTNQGSHYSSSTGRFTAPVAGFYQFNFTGFGYNGGAVGTTNVIVFLRKNGTNYIALVYDHNNVNGTTYPSATGSAAVYLSVNDYVDLYVSSAGIYADTSNLYTAFSGFLVA